MHGYNKKNQEKQPKLEIIYQQQWYIREYKEICASFSCTMLFVCIMISAWIGVLLTTYSDVR